MALAVTLVDSGGIAITDAASLTTPAVPMTPVTSGGIAATPVASGGLPVVLVNETGALHVNALVLAAGGALFDASDLTAIYQAITGGSAGAAGQPAGLVFDKSQMGGATATAFIAAQADLKSGGAIGLVGTATAATYNTTTGEGTAARAANVSNQSYVAFAGLTNGRFYVMNITNTGATSLDVRTNTITTTPVTVTAGTTATVILAALSNTIFVTPRGNNTTCAFTVNTLKALPGYHAIAPADGQRPTRHADGYFDFDGVNDVLNAQIGADLGANVSVYHRTQAGSHVWLTGQTIGAGSYALSTTDWRKAAIIPGGVTAAQQAIIESWGAS